MSRILDNDTYHREHEFTLPVMGDRIRSPLTGILYEIGEALDQGAFGHVFYCVDEFGDDLVAKVIKPFEDRQETERRATSEVLASAVVRSPSIVHIHDAFISRGAHYIISERCHITLRDMMLNDKMSPAVWFPALVKAVLGALHWVHVQGLVHCDVHAGNVFLRFVPDALMPESLDSAASSFKLGDFGLTRPAAEMDPSGTFLTHLRPPEAIRPQEFGPLDHRSDIYQAGLLFLSFLSAEERVFSLDEIIAGTPRQVAETLPSAWGPFLSVLLRRHVEFRPETALDAWRLYTSVPRSN